MIFDIDTTSSVPIYAQIMDQVRHAIAAGILRSGDALPSLREMSGRLRVNPLTVRKAYRELEVEGIAVTEHGRGTYITEQSSKLGEEFRREELSRVVDRMIVDAYHLGASPDEVRMAVEEKLKEQGA
jgi:GntR family transcriptional regulator